MKQLFGPAISLMNRLKYPQKFVLISLLFLLPLLLALFLLISSLNRQVVQTHLELAGTAYLRPLMKLYQDALLQGRLGQQYRNGTASARAAFSQNQAAVDADFVTLDAVERGSAGRVSAAPQATGSRKSWTALEALAPDAPGWPAAYSDLLHNLRLWIHHVGDNSGLILESDLDPHYIMSDVLVSLPELQQFLSQTSELGDAVVTRQRYQGQEREQLTADRALIDNNVSKSESDAVAHMQQTLERPLFKAYTPVQHFSDVLLQQMINPPAPAIPPAALRSASEAAIGSTFDVWSQATAVLDTYLQSRIDRLTLQETQQIALTLIALLLVVYLWIGFYLAVMRTVSSLDEAAQRMVTGDMTSPLRLVNRDELGQVVGSFNRIAVALIAASSYRKAVVDNAAEGIITADHAGRISSFNPAAEDIFGYTAAEVVGEPLGALLAAPAALAPERLAHLALPMPSGETLGRRMDGREFPMEMGLSSMRVGEQTAYVCILRDITWRKRAEAELEQARQTAEDATLAKSEFLANMSHEIRTPMNGVIGMTGLLLSSDLSADQRDYGETIRSSGESLLAILNDILDFSKIEARKLEVETRPFDLRDCVESALDLLSARAAEKDLELAYMLSPQTPAVVEGDVTRLRQILVNLIGNALKFTAEGAVVVTAGSRALPDGRQEIHFAVSDTGIGIAPEQMPRLFKSFSQGDVSNTRRYGGTGLGLVISKNLCELMGGRIWVESQPGQGAVFHFTIVVQPAAGGTRTVVEPQPALQGRRVMIVDDTGANQQILVAYTRWWGLEPQVCTSPAAALAWLRNGAPCEAGILNLKQAATEGPALAAAIRALPDRAGLPLVLFSPVGQRASGEDGRGRTVQLHKPIKPAPLQEALIGLLTGQVLTPRSSADVNVDAHLGERLPLRILLAEDNGVNQKVALLSLQRLGYRADVAGNGREAVAMLGGQPYDLVLMDVQMPEMDGFEATRRIRAGLPTVRQPYIVAMTANAMEGDREACLAAGMDDYTTKPFALPALQALLDRVGRAVQARGGLPPVAPPPPAAAPPVLALAPSGPAPAGPVLDPAMVAQLSLVAGPAELAQLEALFQAETAPLLAGMREALGRHDTEQLRLAAHSLKGSSANVGARSLAAISAGLEHLGRAGTTTGADTLLAQATAEAERVYEALAELSRAAAAVPGGRA